MNKKNLAIIIVVSLVVKLGLTFLLSDSGELFEESEQWNSSLEEQEYHYVGTGVFVNPSFILTNAHVVNECDHIAVVDNKQATPVLLKAKLAANTLPNGQIRTHDYGVDLAILNVDHIKNSFAVFRKQKLVAGEEVVASSYSNAIGGFDGLVGNVINISQDQRIASLDLVSRHGNRGGPLYDKNGYLVGVLFDQMRNSIDESGPSFMASAVSIESFLQYHKVPYMVAKKDGDNISQSPWHQQSFATGIMCAYN